MPAWAGCVLSMCPPSSLQILWQDCWMWKTQVGGKGSFHLIQIGPFIMPGGSWQTRRLIENAHLESQWKIGLHFTFTLAHLGYKKGEREKTKPGGEGQKFNICKCFYISWYKTHDSEWLPKCLNPVRHTKKWMIWTPSVCPFGTCGNGHLSDYLWIWKCIWNNEGPSALLSWQLPVTSVTLAAG